MSSYSDDGILAQDKTLRVRIEQDFTMDEPDEFGFPVLHAEYTNHGARITHTPGDDRTNFNGEDALIRFTETFGYSEGIEIFGRYLAIFHNGNIAEYQDGNVAHIAYSTRILAHSWGIPDSNPVPVADISAWKAYVQGEVYGYITERQVDVSMTDYDHMPVWEKVDACWGFYGMESVKDAAMESFTYHQNAIVSEWAERVKSRPVT